jgi:hypothetical protein
MPIPKKKPIKSEPPATLVLGVPGKTPKSVHKIYKNKKGDVIVDHAGKNKKNDKFNLTTLKGAKSVKQGVQAVKQYHNRKMG